MKHEKERRILGAVRAYYIAESTIRDPVTGGKRRDDSDKTEAGWDGGNGAKSRIKIGIKRYYPPA